MAVRALRRSPGITLLAAGVLSLGLAAPTTFFSLLAGAMRPLPVPEGNRVIRAEVFQPTRAGRALPVTLEELNALQDAETLEALGGFRPFEGTLVDPGRAAARLSGAALTQEVFPLLRVLPTLGRIPGPSEAGGTLLLGYDVWAESYDSDPEVLGRSVTLDGIPRTIVGILPEGFGFPLHHNAWTLLEGGLEDRKPVELVGRLAEGVSMETAQVEMAGIWSRREPLRDTELGGGVMRVQGFTGGRGERGEGVAFLGLVAVGLALLLIACSNVANLLLVRATERVKILAVQAAVGAGRIQISLQLLFESMVVALLGGVGGVFLAWLAVGAIEDRLAAEHFGYFWMRMAVDGWVLAFTGVLVLGTALLAGLLPVVRVLKTNLQQVLKEESAGIAVGGGGAWSRGFVTAQLTLSCGALVAAGLTGVGMIRGGSFGRGIPADEILVASISPGTKGSQGQLLDLVGALEEIPGVRSAALALGAPGYFEPSGPVQVEGVGIEGFPDRAGGLWNAVTPGFFSVLDLELRAGRNLDPGDDSGTPPVAVVNESFVARFLGSGDPLGRRVRLASSDTAAWLTVVGVVADVDMGGGPRVPLDRLYLSQAQIPPQDFMILLRSGPEPLGLVPELRTAIARVDPSIPIWSIRTLTDGHAYITRVPKAMGGIALGGGIAGFLVASVGLYGLLAFRVRQRRKELGVRLAMGADGPRLAREVLTVAVVQILPALAMGLALAWLVAPLMAVALMGGEPRSLLVFLGVGVAFLTAGLGAALPSALRASALDPSSVLRGE